jgi:hypothetical protein
MQRITSIEALRNKRRLKQDELILKEQEVKEQFNRTLESLKPVNLARSMVIHVVRSPYFIDNVIGIGVGLATGYLSRKLVTGASRLIVRKLLGSVLQVGMAKLIIRRPDGNPSYRQPVFKNIFRRKELNSRTP